MPVETPRKKVGLGYAQHRDLPGRGDGEIVSGMRVLSQPHGLLAWRITAGSARRLAAKARFRPRPSHQPNLRNAAVSRGRGSGAASSGPGSRSAAVYGRPESRLR